jgi:2-polyprenyl-6-methoxyphenol hydroxylase-like FAD-dependent oxidoreductase
LIEKAGFNERRFGESAPPELRAELIGLGLGELTKLPFCRDAPAVVSLWGSKMPVIRDHILSPWGRGLHLDRRAFDEALAAAARDTGAELERGTARFSRRSGGGYDVEVSNGRRLQCAIAVLAAGRSGGRAGLPFRRNYLDSNVAVAGVFTPRSSYEALAHTLVESTSNGWFYLAATPDGSVVAVYVTLALLVPSGGRDRMRWWLSAIAATHTARKALYGYTLPRTVFVLDARGSYAAPCSGEDWLAIGDARLAPDPLSGQGLLWSIDDARGVIDLMNSGYCSDVAAKRSARGYDDVRSYALDRMRVYRSESRFANSPFWLENQRNVRFEAAL